jgi:hypothetical protein
MITECDRDKVSGMGVRGWNFRETGHGPAIYGIYFLRVRLSGERGAGCMVQDRDRAWMWGVLKNAVAGLTPEETWRHPIYRTLVGFTRITPSPDFLDLAMTVNSSIVQEVLAAFRAKGLPIEFRTRGLPVDPVVAVTGQEDPAQLDPGSVTALHLYFLSRCCDYAGVSRFDSVVEIGGGFGDLARLFAVTGKAGRVTIVDLPEMLRVQRWFLSQTPGLVDYVDFVDATSAEARQTLYSRDFDLGISTYALTEIPADMQRSYADGLLSRCRHVYLAGPRHRLDDVLGWLTVDNRIITACDLPSACHSSDIDAFACHGI